MPSFDVTSVKSDSEEFEDHLRRRIRREYQRQQRGFITYNPLADMVAQKRIEAGEVKKK